MLMVFVVSCLLSLTLPLSSTCSCSRRYLSPRDGEASRLLHTALEQRVVTSLFPRGVSAIRPAFLRTPSTSEASIHVTWRLWQEGPGWCQYFQGAPNADGRRYWIFEPGWLRMVQLQLIRDSSGSAEWKEEILVIRELLESSFEVAAAASPDRDRGEGDAAAAAAADRPPSDSAELAVGAAVGSLTNAVQTVSPSQDAVRLLPLAYLPSVEFPRLPALSSWSCVELRAFLHGWERLSRGCELLRYAGATHLSLRGKGEWLPVMLPWPREYGPGDIRPPKHVFLPRCHRTLQWWEVAEWEGKWQPNPEGDFSDGSLPVFDPLENLDLPPLLASVRPLSSVVRGCPWPLDVVNDEGDDGLTRREQECRVVARRVALTLRLSRELYDGGVTTAWWHQPGPRSAQTRSWTWEERSPGVEEMFGLDPSLAAATTATSYMQELLTSSLVVSLGSEHAYPWPVLLLAPLAPGWIGGFITTATSMG